MREAVLLLLLGGGELAILLGLGLMRPDMALVIGSAYMLWKLGSLAVLAAVCCTVAMRSFSPPASPRRGLMLALALAGMAMVTGMFVASGDESGQTLVGRLSPVHGLFCTISIVILSLPIVTMLAVLMRRAAPVFPQKSALAAGLAASTCGALIFAFCCPMNDPLYIIVWYFAACAAVTASARWILPRRFGL
jgi:hypothetical protein